MSGLLIRMARALNRVMNRKGRVFSDRYHAHILKTVNEVRNALHYVVHNHKKHVPGLPNDYKDPFVFVGVAPNTWLLQNLMSKPLHVGNASRTSTSENQRSRPATAGSGDGGVFVGGRPIRDCQTPPSETDKPGRPQKERGARPPSPFATPPSEPSTSEALKM